MHSLTVLPEEWRTAVEDLTAAGARLVTVWAQRDGRNAPTVRAVFLAEHNGLVLSLKLRDPDAPYPGLEDFFPAAARLQRAIADLSGLRSSDPDMRPWLRHGAWPPDYRPLIDPPRPPTDGPLRPDAYEFVRVEGDGVHEIPVGPVHAGVIEPGHFRFSIVGEKVLRLEERLGYLHKGIERRSQGCRS
jgi:Ni,Fe-hydrogenase III component G